MQKSACIAEMSTKVSAGGYFLMFTGYIQWWLHGRVGLIRL